MRGGLENVYIARQPILDGNGALWAYELLFRSCNLIDRADVTDATSATAQVLRNSVAVGLKNVVGSNKAFFNCDRNILLSDVLSVIDSSVFVLEILQSVEFDDELIAAVKKLREESDFLIALDDFVYDEDNVSRAEKIMEYIDIIKMDLLRTPKELWKKSADYINRHGKMSLAEKVETEDDFKECKKYGFDFFQGYFFAKPQIMQSARIGTSAATAIDLLHFVRSDGDLKGVEIKFKQSPEMALSLLKLINSAALGLRSPIMSISHAIAMFGTKNLERWLMLLLYAQQGTDTVVEPLSPLFDNASMRALIMENVAKEYLATASTADQNNTLPEKAYFVGLVSRTDALFGMHIAMILEEFNFDDEINTAILQGRGVLGTMLNLVCAYENDDGKQVKEFIESLKITPERFSHCVRNSFKKVLV